MEFYRTMPASPIDGNVLVYGPDGFNASADTFEDAVMFVAKLEALAAEVERLRESLRWIPVVERVPEDYSTVLAAWGGFQPVYTAFIDEHGKWGECQTGEDVEPSHWMHVPEPPESA